MPLINANVVASRHIKRAEVLLLVAVRHSKTPELNLNFIRATKTSCILLNLNFLGETAFLEGIFCLEYPNIHVSQTTDFHFANYRFPFRKLQIFISQTTDFHFANYRFPFRKLQIPISQTTDFHFANYRFPFHFIPFRFPKYGKPQKIALIAI